MEYRLIIKRVALVIALSFGFIGIAHAADSNLSIDGIWCGLSGQHPHRAYVYLTISLKKGNQGDKLIGVATDAADGVELLAPISPGRTRLMPTPSIQVDTKAPTILQPYGTHIILRALKNKLEIGQQFTLSLSFEHAGKIDIQVPVLAKPPINDMPKLPKSVKLD